MKTLLYIIVFAVVAMLAFRFYPVDSEAFHEDPAEPDPHRSEVRLIGREAPRYPAGAIEVLRVFAQIATSDRGVHVVQGSIEEGMITLVARSKVFGFRDYITVKAVDEGREAKMSILARPRLNGNDWGENAARLDRWLQDMENTFRR